MYTYIWIRNMDYSNKTGNKNLNCRNEVLEECSWLHKEGPNKKYYN
jgi:hypothetical protein